MKIITKEGLLSLLAVTIIIGICVYVDYSISGDQILSESLDPKFQRFLLSIPPPPCGMDIDFVDSGVNYTCNDTCNNSVNDTCQACPPDLDPGRCCTGKN